MSRNFSQNRFNSDIFYPIFDSEENGQLFLPINVTQMAQKVVQSGQPPPKMAKIIFFMNETKTIRARDTNVLKHF